MACSTWRKYCINCFVEVVLIMLLVVLLLTTNISASNVSSGIRKDDVSNSDEVSWEENGVDFKGIPFDADEQTKDISDVVKKKMTEAMKDNKLKGRRDRTETYVCSLESGYVLTIKVTLKGLAAQSCWKEVWEQMKQYEMKWGELKASKIASNSGCNEYSYSIIEYTIDTLKVWEFQWKGKPYELESMNGKNSYSHLSTQLRRLKLIAI